LTALAAAVPEALAVVVAFVGALAAAFAGAFRVGALRAGRAVLSSEGAGVVIGVLGLGASGEARTVSPAHPVRGCFAHLLPMFIRPATTSHAARRAPDDARTPAKPGSTVLLEVSGGS
jgi:hypothetical protein